MLMCDDKISTYINLETNYSMTEINHFAYMEWKFNSRWVLLIEDSTQLENKESIFLFFLTGIVCLHSASVKFVYLYNVRKI